MAILIEECRAVFLHVPKTAGVWVENALCRSGLTTRKINRRHATREMICEPDIRTWFTFIRHPLSWYASWWKYYHSVPFADEMAAHPNVWNPLRCLIPCMHVDFNRTVNQIIETHPSFVSKLFETYTSGADRVGITEDLPLSLCDILDSLGCVYDRNRVLNVPRANVSPGDAIPDDRTITRVLEMEHESVRFHNSYRRRNRSASQTEAYQFER